MANIGNSIRSLFELSTIGGFPARPSAQLPMLQAYAQIALFFANHHAMAGSALTLLGAALRLTKPTKKS